MIDWLTLQIPYKHNFDMCIRGNKRFETNSKTGEIVWEFDMPEKIEGSHSSTIRVSSDGDIIRIDGNPTKYFLGHNVYGTNSYTLIDNFVESILAKINVQLSPAEMLQVKRRNYAIHRIDITNHVDFGSNSIVDEVLRVAEKQAYKRMSRAVLTGSTLYFSKTSKYWTIKAYNKNLELKNKSHHKEFIKKDEGHYQRLLDYTEGHLRIELTLRKRQFNNKHKIKTLRELQKKYPNLDTLFNEYNKKIEWNGTMKKLDQKTLETMTKSLANHYKHWLRGDDLSQELSKAQFYRVRKQLKDCGIDVSFPNPDTDTKLIKTINIPEIIYSAEPVQLPDFANYDYYKLAA